MASKTINTILNLKDRMSGGIVKVSSKVKGMSKEAQRTSREVANMANNFKKKVDEMSGRALKFGGVMAGVGGVLALKTGFAEAFDLEGFRMQLETATKDTKKAADIMRYSIDLANKTPFEGGELVQGASKLESMGLSAKKWLPLIGDMAAATNKPFDQAIEAFIDSQTGELERLKEFGVTKAKIADKAAKMYKNKTVINNKGQIVDFEKFNNAMVAIMQEKFTGGMEKQSNTMKGVWSTVTGVTKSALSEMVGMSADGTIKTGSMMDKLKTKVKEIADKFQQWQNDGSLQKLSDKVTEIFGKIYDVSEKVFNFIMKNKDTFGFLLALFLGFSAGIKVAHGLAVAIQVLQVAWGLFNGTLAMTPLGWVVLGITALVAAGYLLWKNWDKVSLGLSKAMESIKDGFVTSINWIVDKINWLIKKINIIPGVNIPLIAELPYGRKAAVNTYDRIKDIDMYANGGVANKPSIFGEDGPEVAIPLKKTPRSLDLLNKTNKALGATGGISVYVTIQGNVIGNEEFTDEVGESVVSKILLALDNM